MGETVTEDRDRLLSLDYLRGLAAFGIMVFHYTSWLYGELNAQTFLGRVGIYGVSIFYVLSGLTLHHVYGEQFQTKANIKGFFVKRFFRIYPLLWLVMLATIALNRTLPSLTTLGLNLSGLFGFVKWDEYVGVGVWSIGNELTFYAAFPIFMYAVSKSRWVLGAICTLVFAIYLTFAFYVIDPSIPIFDQWRNYVNPLNQIFLFLSGIVIGYFFQSFEIGRVFNYVLIVFALLFFIFFPTQPEITSLVSGLNRLLFTFLCIAVCIGFLRVDFALPGILHRVLAAMGEASYSIYLLHPLVYRGVGIVLSKVGGGSVIRFTVSILVTLVVSQLVYSYFEKYFMRIGKAVATRFSQ